MKTKAIFLIIFLCISQLAYGQYLVPTLDKASNKYGYKENDKIDWSLDPIYISASYFIGNIAVVNNGEYDFVIDLHGKQISPYFLKIQWHPGSETLPFVCKELNGTYNLYDYQFRPICQKSYQAMSYLYDAGLLSFKTENLYGIMDMEGNVLIQPTYNKIHLSGNDYYYACGFKRCDTDGITPDMFKGAFLEAQDTNKKYGIITLDNKQIVPFKYKRSYEVTYKGAKSAYKEIIKPYLLSTDKKELDVRVEEAKNRSAARNAELARVYPTDLPVVEKTFIKQTDAGYAFFKAGKQMSKIYQSLISYSKCCVVSENGKFGITNLLGSEMVKCEYDTISIWNTENGTDILMTEAHGKFNLIKEDGTQLTAFDCDMIFMPSNNAGVARKGEQSWLIDLNGNIVSDHGYETIDNYSSDNKIYAELLGYRTELYSNGKEVSPIAKQIYEEASKMSISNNAKNKLDKYMLCSSLDPNNNDGYKALSLNGIGAMLEELGDTDSALNYYAEARSLGNDEARKNIRRVKFDKVLHTLKDVGDVMVQISQLISSSPAGVSTQYSSDDYQTYSNENYAVTADGNTNKHSYEFWQQQYARWESNARSCYESLTNGGHKTKKKGKDTGGSADGSWGSTSFTMMKTNLRNAQREMRNIRAQANSEGFNIPQSNYETINVSF